MDGLRIRCRRRGGLAVPSRGYDARVHALPEVVYRLIERLAFIGVTPTDSGEVRDRKVTLTLAAVTVTALAVIWVGTYLALGLPSSAAIPFAYQVASLVTLAVFARTKDYRFFRASQLVLMLLLPFLLQLSLGGYVASSAVSLWALVAALGALFFYSAREAMPWFVAFIGLTVVAGLLEPLGLGTPRRHPGPGPDGLLRAQHLRCRCDCLPAAPVLDPGPRRRARELRAAAPQRAAGVDRRAAEAPRGPHRRGP